MAITPQQILESAYARSMKNKPGTIASESVELLAVVGRALYTLYQFAARINPTFFGKKEDVGYSGTLGGWPKPVTAESIHKIEFTDGSGTVWPVVAVPFDDKAAESGKYAVYKYGSTFFRDGIPLAPATTQALTFYFSKLPDQPTSLTVAIDATWPDSHNELLILEVALYLALKDLGESGREQEIQSLVAERNGHATRFGAFLEHELANEVRRFGHVRRFNTNFQVPIHTFLVNPVVGLTLPAGQAAGG